MEDMIANSVQNLFHEFLTILTKCIIDVTASNQEHVGSDFERHFFSDLEDGSFVCVNLSLESLSLKWFSLQEGVDSLSFLQDKEIVIVDTKSKLDDL